MKTLREVASCLHAGRSGSDGLRERDTLRLLGWAADVLRRLGKLHRRGLFHGDVGPDAVRIGSGGAKLAGRGETTAPREFRDPDRERLGLRDPRSLRKAEPRHDLYGVGATLFFLLDGGPPACGPGTPFTRPVPRAVAFVVYRAMADGPGRYPSARTMREDLVRLGRLAKRRGLDAVQPEELPSYRGGRVPEPRLLSAFVPPERRAASRGRRVLARLALVSLLAVSGVAIAARGGWEQPRAGVGGTAAAPAAERETLEEVVREWRGELDGLLAAAGAELDPLSVPLLVVSEVGPLPSLDWPRHPSDRLERRIRAVLRQGADAKEVQETLLSELDRGTLPAVLWVVPAGPPGQVRVRLMYRGLLRCGKVPG